MMIGKKVYVTEEGKRVVEDATLEDLLRLLSKFAEDNGEDDGFLNDVDDLEDLFDEEKEEEKPKHLMDANKFRQIMNANFKKIKELWARKNKEYGVEGDVLAGIRENTKRAFSEEVYQEDMFTVIMNLKDKHDLALLRKGTYLDDAKERLYDVIIYSFLALAVLDATDEELRG